MNNSEADLYCVPVVRKGSTAIVWAGVIWPSGGEPSDLVLYGTAPSDVIGQASTMSYYGSGEASQKATVPSPIAAILADKGDEIRANGATATRMKKGEFKIIAVGGPADMCQEISNKLPKLGDEVLFTLIGKKVRYYVTTPRAATVWEAKFAGY